MHLRAASFYLFPPTRRVIVLEFWGHRLAYFHRFLTKFCIFNTRGTPSFPGILRVRIHYSAWCVIDSQWEAGNTLPRWYRAKDSGIYAHIRRLNERKKGRDFPFSSEFPHYYAEMHHGKWFTTKNPTHRYPVCWGEDRDLRLRTFQSLMFFRLLIALCVMFGNFMTNLVVQMYQNKTFRGW